MPELNLDAGLNRFCQNETDTAEPSGDTNRNEQVQGGAIESENEVTPPNSHSKVRIAQKSRVKIKK
jgi:hypothetical protein